MLQPERVPWPSPWPTQSQLRLLQTLFGPDERALEHYAGWRAAVDLERDLDSASYRLLPMLDARLRALGVSDDFSGRYKGVHRKAWVDNSLLFGDVAEVLIALTQAGIMPALSKGAPLAMLHYRSHALRPMSDVDIVVREQDLARAEAIIASVPGWRRMGARQREIARRYHHSINFDGRKGGIDLHWHFLFEARAAAVDDWFWKGARRFDFHGVEMLCPAPTALLLTVIVHGLRSNPASPIRWVADAITILRADPAAIDWKELRAFARKHRLGHRLGLGLHYLRAHFDVPIPAEIPERLLAKRQSLVERIENTMYLGDPSAFLGSKRRLLWRGFVQYLPVLKARTGAGLLLRLPARLPHFLRYVLVMYRQRRNASHA
jgi:hypothetical protein